MNSRPTIHVQRLVAGSLRTGVRWVSAKPKPEYTPNEEYGEKIFLIRHIDKNHVLYSFTPTISPAQVKRQIPFNGKKLFPATIRKDYWDTMALIQLPSGAGKVGQAVMQRLREFRRRHELEWEDPLFDLSRYDRGVALNDQLAFAVADVAAVLSGAGKGNLMVAENKRLTKAERLQRAIDTRKAAMAAAAERRAAKKDGRAMGQAMAETAATEHATTEAATTEVATTAPAATKAETSASVEETSTTRTLTPVTIYWQDLMDAAHAQSWSENVSHAVMTRSQQGQTYRRKPFNPETDEPRIRLPWWEKKAEKLQKRAAEAGAALVASGETKENQSV